MKGPSPAPFSRDTWEVTKYHNPPQSQEEEAHVIDLGSGVGTLSLLAARAGADSVVAVEAHAGMAAVARRSAALNGVSGVVSVVEQDAAVLQVRYPPLQTALRALWGTRALFRTPRRCRSDFRLASVAIPKPLSVAYEPLVSSSLPGACGSPAHGPPA